jgi:MoaA/NifB/PqqE/SkfB family radical SAM enzyme
MTDKKGNGTEPRPPTDFGDKEFPLALVCVTNACNLQCTHCFVFRGDNPNQPRDKMDDATMLHQLEVLRDRHKIQSIYFMGGEPMIRKELVFEAMKLFDNCAIVTNGTYGIPSVPGHVVVVSLDGPAHLNDPIRGDGVFAKVERSVHARARDDGTTVILQMILTRQNGDGAAEFVERVRDWPIEGIAFGFYVPTANDDSAMSWKDLAERDAVVEQIIALKREYPSLIKSHIGALEMLMSDRAADYTGERGENCLLLGASLPLYMGEGGNFERTFCCYGNDVDCSRCGSYLVFNAAYQKQRGNDDPVMWAPRSA